MSLENILRNSAVGTLASASAIFLVSGYRSFVEGENLSGATYFLASLIPIALATAGYRYRHYSSKTSEETGLFGVPDQAIRAIEKRDSGRHHRL